MALLSLVKLTFQPNNRSLEINYVKAGNNSASSKTTNVVVNKGTPKITLNLKPDNFKSDTKTINNKVTLTTNISGMEFNTQNKWHNTIKFYNNGILQHQVNVPIKINSYNKGFSVQTILLKRVMRI